MSRGFFHWWTGKGKDNQRKRKEDKDGFLDKGSGEEKQERDTCLELLASWCQDSGFQYAAVVKCDGAYGLVDIVTTRS